MKDYRNKPLTLADEVAYADDSVVSKVILQKETGNLTIFAFDKGQGLSEHTSPFDAVIEILDGTASVKVGDALHTVHAGETLIMPANIPHALDAEERFKMLLIMIRSEQ